MDPDYGNFAYLTAFPGSVLYEEAIRNDWYINGRPDSFSYEELRLNATEISDKELEQALVHMVRSFYLRPDYIFKRLKRLTFNDLRNSIKGLCNILSSY
jgi:hypothetical protein